MELYLLIKFDKGLRFTSLKNFVLVFSFNKLTTTVYLFLLLALYHQ